MVRDAKMVVRVRAARCDIYVELAVTVTELFSKCLSISTCRLLNIRMYATHVLVY